MIRFSRMFSLVVGCVLLAVLAGCVSTGVDIQNDGQLSDAEKAKLEAVLGESPIIVSTTVGCDRTYTFSDQRGSFYVQRQCGGWAIPWGFQLSPHVQAIVAGPVSERGMDWNRDGRRQPRQAPHLGVPAVYVFHGTFGATAGSVIEYDDVLSFRHNIGPGGTVTLTIHGNLTFTDERGQ